MYLYLYGEPQFNLFRRASNKMKHISPQSASVWRQNIPSTYYDLNSDGKCDVADIVSLIPLIK